MSIRGGETGSALEQDLKPFQQQQHASRAAYIKAGSALKLGIKLFWQQQHASGVMPRLWELIRCGKLHTPSCGISLVRGASFK